MEKIVLNATAARCGGALTILRQFLNHFPENYKLYAFISVGLFELPQRPNIQYINPKANSWFKRLIWDYWGLNNWCKKHKVRPNLIVSLQNTGVKFKGKVKQLIYYHQSTPLYPYKWRFFKKSQRHLWFYKNIYLWFVKATITENTMIIVQFDWIKLCLGGLLKKHQNKIQVVKPSFDNFNIELVEKNNWLGALHIFYPASFIEYKNHLEIINAFIYLKNKKILGEYTVYFTCNLQLAPMLLDLINENQLQKHFMFINRLDEAEVLRYYKSCDMVVFPSYIETFGLPLIEAAAFGRKILAADLDYAHEVLENYQGVEFIPIHDSKAWGDAIHDFAHHMKEFTPWRPSYAENSWGDFFSVATHFMSC